MKERVIYNSYYESFEAFRAAVFSFFHTLSTVSEKFVIGKALKEPCEGSV
jgi:hypothetical protein